MICALARRAQALSAAPAIVKANGQLPVAAGALQQSRQLEAGLDFPLDERFSMFLDAKKALLRPVATGTFGGAPVVGQTRLDPWALTAGVSFKL